MKKYKYIAQDTGIAKDSNSYMYKGYRITYSDSTVYFRDNDGKYYHFANEEDAEEYIDDMKKEDAIPVFWIPYADDIFLKECKDESVPYGTIPSEAFNLACMYLDADGIDLTDEEADEMKNYIHDKFENIPEAEVNKLRGWI